MNKKTVSEDTKLLIIDFYKNHSNTQTRKKYEISEAVLQNILDQFNIARHSKRENLIFTCEETQGGLGFASSIHQNKVRKTCLDKYGDPYFNNMEKNKQTKIERYGSYEEYLNHWQEVKNSTLIKKYGSVEKAYEEIWDNQHATLQDKYGVINASQLPDIASKKSKKYCIDGYTFDSSWEVLIYNYAKANNLPIERPIVIPFDYPLEKHVTLIDFKIDGYLIEVKANHLLNGYFDSDSTVIKIEDKLKLYKSYNVNIITSNYSNPDVNIVDIKLFTNNTNWSELKKYLIK